MSQPRDDQNYIRAAAQELETYLLSSVLFWPLTGHKGAALKGDSSQLTPGNLLLSLKRLHARADSMAEGVMDLEQVAHIERLREQWRSNWQKKARQELDHRLTLWKNYLDNLTGMPQHLRGDFQSNIRQRVVLELLMIDLNPAGQAQAAVLAALDERLRAISQPRAFIWDDSVKSGFPGDPFWFLYIQV